jgi:tetratricopeptide (TPR) repeat protein
VKRTVLAGLLVVATVAAVYAYAATGRERTYRRLIDTGDAAMAREDGYEAIEAFSGAIAHKADSMLGYLKRGEAYALRGEYAAALRDLRRATDLDPAAPRPQELFGDVNYALRRYDRAAQRYEAYLRLDDRSPRILYKLGLAHYSAGQPFPALSALRKAIALEDKFAEAHYLLGMCLRDVENPRGALRALERSVALAPAMLQAREELADLYSDQGRQRDRIKQLEALLALDPAAWREVALGLAYAEAGRLESAVLRLGEATERYPDHSYPYVALGRVWLETAQRDRAPGSRRVSLSKALAALEGPAGSAESSEAMTLFGRALLMAGADVERAERMLQLATEKLPVDPSAFFYLAEAAERRGRPDVARRALIDYHAIGGGERDGRLAAGLADRIADLSMRLNDAPAAVRWYQRAADASPSDTALLTQLAEAQLRAGDAAGARASVDKLLEKDPTNQKALVLIRRLQ